jgi:hypothetical protein
MARTTSLLVSTQQSDSQRTSGLSMSMQDNQWNK